MADLEPRTIWDIPSEPVCVCCAGRMTEGDDLDPDRMCDACLRAAVADVCEHMLRSTDKDILRSLPSRSVTVTVPATDHENGRAWHWLAAVEAVRSACAACRPGGPCWRHEKVATIMRGHSGAVGMVLGPAKCEAIRHVLDGQAGHLPVAGVLVDGPMRRTMCNGCALERLGPALDPEALSCG